MSSAKAALESDTRVSFLIFLLSYSASLYSSSFFLEIIIIIIVEPI